MQNDINNPYLKKAEAVFKADVEEIPAVRLGNLIPFLVHPLIYLMMVRVIVVRALNKLLPATTKYIEEFPSSWLINRVQEVVNLRKKSPLNTVKPADLLQLMMDVSTDDEVKVSVIVIVRLIEDKIYLIDLGSW
jgi:hypothetical protein